MRIYKPVMDINRPHLKRRLAVRLRANKFRNPIKINAMTLLNNDNEPEKLKEALTVNVTELIQEP